MSEKNGIRVSASAALVFLTLYGSRYPIYGVNDDKSDPVYIFNCERGRNFQIYFGNFCSYCALYRNIIGVFGKI